MAGAITVFRARRILTMDPSCPEATHVAVREGRVLAVGGEAETSAWGPVRTDDRFRDLVLMPGLVEGHSHAWEGGIWAFTYAGFFERADPEGRRWPGCDSIETMVLRLAEAERSLPPGQPLYAWGFDPIYFGERRVTTAEPRPRLHDAARAAAALQRPRDERQHAGAASAAASPPPTSMA